MGEGELDPLESYITANATGCSGYLFSMTSNACFGISYKLLNNMQFLSNKLSSKAYSPKINLALLPKCL